MAKITEEELKNINDLKENTTRLVYALGELEYQKISLEFLLDDLKDKVKTIKIEEAKFLDELKNKYGNVNINIETGEFS